MLAIILFCKTYLNSKYDKVFADHGTYYFFRGKVPTSNRAFLEPDKRIAMTWNNWIAKYLTNILEDAQTYYCL